MSTHKMSNRVTSTSKKNDAFFDAYMNDLRKTGHVEDVYVARVIRNVGNGRVEVFYVGPHGARTEMAYIRGLFRGKGKHSVNIHVNSVVLLADTGISGSAQYEIMCALSPVQIRDLRKAATFDDRIFSIETTDGETLVKKKAEEDGFEFDVGEDDNVDVDAI